MRYQSPTFALLALPATVLAVSLADFKPRVSGLPSNCQTVYTQTIDGCSPNDFTASTCSTGCVKALQALAADVKSACGDEDIRGTNVIAAFLNNAGPRGLCTNANAVLGSESTPTSPATSAKPSTSSSGVGTTSTRQASSTSSEVLTTTATSSTETATSLTSTTSAPSSTIALDTSSSPTATPTNAASHSSSNGNSGGGSPFDTEGNTNSAGAALEVTMAAILFAVSLTLTGALR